MIRKAKRGHGLAPTIIWERLPDGSVRQSGRMSCAACGRVIVFDNKAGLYRHTRERAPYLYAEVRA